MSKWKAWLGAARLRTLPLSVSGIIVGASLGNTLINDMNRGITKEKFGGLIDVHFPAVYETALFWLAILTTIGFQVLSNFANDYGDGVKGTDANREGEQRMVASGVISPSK